MKLIRVVKKDVNKTDTEIDDKSKAKIESVKKLGVAINKMEKSMKEVSTALDEFKKAHQDSPEVIREKMKHWNELVNHFYQLY